jgi:hypothetical protein
LENKQKMQLDNIKYVLEHSGSKRLNRLSKRIFGKRTEYNKLPQLKPKQTDSENKYKKPTEEEIREEKKIEIIREGVTIYLIHRKTLL